jgi:Tfp pilus assembly protein PilO
LALIIFGLFYMFYYKGKDEELRNIREERIRVEDEVARLQIKKQELDKIEAEIKQMAVMLTELEEIIPKKREISTILRRIQQLANDSRLDVISFAPQGEVEKEFYSEWPIPIEIRGSYHNLAIFFDRLSRFSRIFNVEDFLIKALNQQTQGTTISAEFTAKTYIFREEETISETDKNETGNKK